MANVLEIPSTVSGVAPPIDPTLRDATARSLGEWAKTAGKVVGPDAVPLTFDPEAIVTALSDDTLAAKKTLVEWLDGKIGGVFAEIATTIVAALWESLKLMTKGGGIALGLLEAWKEEGRQTGNAAERPTLVDLVPLALGVFRQQVSRDRYFEEAAKHGYSDERANYLLVIAKQILSVPDIQQALNRGILKEPQAERRIEQNGYDADDVKVLLALREQLLSPGEVVSLWLRGRLSSPQLSQRLGQFGFPDKQVEEIKELSKVIPGVQDLVMLAVKEAFNPEQIKFLELDEEFPDAILPHTRAQGLSDDWSKKYWEAHWQLPSPQQGFEMLHRGLITDDDLAKLLKALDYSPKWREKLKQISYIPFTRVDIRRMYSVGVLDEAGVEKAYREQGASPDHATLLKNFTIIEELATEIGRVKSTLLEKFQSGLVSEADVREFLSKLKTPQAMQDALIAAELQAREVRLLQKQVDAIKHSFLAGDIDMSRASALLLGLNVPAEGLVLMAREWPLERELQRKFLPLVDIRNGVKEGTLSEKQVVEQLTRQHYSESDAKLFYKIQTTPKPSTSSRSKKTGA